MSGMQNLAVKEFPSRDIPITVEMYHLMNERGYFDDDDRVELVDGEIFDMSPIGNLHARCVDFLTKYLVTTLADGFIVRVQNAVTLDPFSEPQPDFSIVRFRSDFYISGLPQSSDVEVVFEVADTSLAFDGRRKFPRYAGTGIPEAWLVDLKSQRVEIHSKPSGERYELVTVLQRGQMATSTVIPKISLPVNDILG